MSSKPAWLEGAISGLGCAALVTTATPLTVSRPLGNLALVTVMITAFVLTGRRSFLVPASCTLVALDVVVLGALGHAPAIASVLAGSCVALAGLRLVLAFLRDKPPSPQPSHGQKRPRKFAVQL